MSTYDDIKSHQFQYHIHIPHHPTLSNPWPCELCPARRLGPTTPRSRTKDPERSRTPAMPAASSTLRTQLEAFQTCPNSKRSWWSWSALVHCFFCWEVNITGLVWGKIYRKPWFSHGFSHEFFGGVLHIFPWTNPGYPTGSIPNSRSWLLKCGVVFFGWERPPISGIRSRHFGCETLMFTLWLWLTVCHGKYWKMMAHKNGWFTY